jgi:hypothetical protein
MRLLYSTYYEYINKKCIETFFINDGDTENETITLFEQHKSLSIENNEFIKNDELIKFSGNNDLFYVLYIILNKNLNHRISSLVDNTWWVHYQSYIEFKEDLNNRVFLINSKELKEFV